MLGLDKEFSGWIIDYEEINKEFIPIIICYPAKPKKSFNEINDIFGNIYNLFLHKEGYIEIRELYKWTPKN